ncbi:hypothetical protein D8827_04435 [Streptococcus intermedius]|uniref:DUF1310 domain-containing protein n=1 Tax=Streptococcus intermedius TaxID=1338 RepID=A0AAE8G4A3_STRIT|nr:DUF1310 family protein [Streptococcus intermedius]EHG12123.1 hypothetical protein HMPREF9177_01121 [Streptococcus intermedius F0413]MDK8091778.1 DUF1310 family protein [Streptococcus intermedius]QKH77128.1 DUF1310 family protein [Streptococcus intermedius]RSJ23764.1 hypothetical protein D8827_04435 [Streptococcus intermedius]
MRKKKLMWSFISILAVIGMAVGGWAMHQHQEKQKMIQIANSKEAKKVYERGIEYENSKAFSDGLIKTYKIDEDSLKYNPMGGLMVTVIINGKKELTVGYNLIDQGDGSYDSAYYTYSPELVSYLKEKR